MVRETSEGVCYDSINHHILNRCISLGSMNLIRDVTMWTLEYVSPSIVLSFLTVVITAIPFIFERTSRHMRGKTLTLYDVVRFTLIGVYHRIGYSYTIVSILKFVIDQPAPCTCSTASRPVSENMPYMYTSTATVIALTIFDLAAFGPAWVYVIAAVIGIVPNILYLLSGWASIAQVLGTMLLSTSLHIYSSRTSNRAMLIEGVILLIANLSGLIWYVVRGKKMDANDSPVVALFRGVLVLIYDVFLVLRFLMRNKWGYFTIHRGVMIAEDDVTALRSSLLTSESDVANYRIIMSGDKRDGIIGFCAVLLLKTVEYALRQIKSK